MRRVAFIIAAMVLGACGMRDPSVFQNETNTEKVGNWRIEKSPDRITGLATPSAQAFTTKASNSNVEFAKGASVQLTCFENKPVVRFAFDFKIGNDRNTVFGYRFDEKPGHDNVESRVIVGYMSIVIEDQKEVARFVEELKTSTTLVARVRSMNAGRSVAEFQVDGAAAAIEAGFAGCPLVAEQPRKPGKPS